MSSPPTTLMLPPGPAGTRDVLSLNSGCDFAKIGNIGPDAVSAKVVFTVYDGAGNAVGGTESNVATISLVGDAVVFGEWRAGTGRFHVVAQCWFDSNGNGTFDSFDSNTKEFSFAVVL